MRFFTHDLSERLHSADEAVASAAEQEWEAVNEPYEEHLRALEPCLPEHIRQFNNLLLHDALVWGIARRGSQLIMVLRKDIPPQNLVLLTYTLTADPVIDPEALPLAQRLQVMDSQYDEFDVVREGDQLTYMQSVVFSNGWEMVLQFRDVQVTEAEPLYPFPGTMLIPASTSVLSQSA